MTSYMAWQVGVGEQWDRELEVAKCYNIHRPYLWHVARIGSQ